MKKKRLSLDDKISDMLIYVIVCARGPGSETLTARISSPIKKIFMLQPEEEYGDYEVEKEKTRILNAELQEQALTGEGKKILVKGKEIEGIETVHIATHDEGLTYRILGTISIRDMLTAVLFNDELVARAATDEGLFAFQAASYRAIVNNLLSRKKEVWSSMNGWRGVEYELMPKWQVEQCMELFEMTEEETLVCKCDVLRASMVMPSTKYTGCL